MFKIIHFYVATIPTDIAFKSQKSGTESNKMSVINTSKVMQQNKQVTYSLLMRQRAYLCKQQKHTYFLHLKNWLVVHDSLFKVSTSDTQLKNEDIIGRDAFSTMYSQMAMH